MIHILLSGLGSPGDSLYDTDKGLTWRQLIHLAPYRWDPGSRVSSSPSAAAVSAANGSSGAGSAGQTPSCVACQVVAGPSAQMIVHVFVIVIVIVRRMMGGMGTAYRVCTADRSDNYAKIPQNSTKDRFYAAHSGSALVKMRTALRFRLWRKA